MIIRKTEALTKQKFEGRENTRRKINVGISRDHFAWVLGRKRDILMIDTEIKIQT